MGDACKKSVQLGGTSRRNRRLHICAAHPVAADSGGHGLRAGLLRDLGLQTLLEMNGRRGQRQPGEGGHAPVSNVCSKVWLRKGR